MAVTDGPNATQCVDGIVGRRALIFTLNGALQAVRIRGHHAVGEQRQGTGRSDQLLGAPTALCG